jgi:anti-sigma B factor antagonist
MELNLSHEPGYVLAKTSGPIDESARPLLAEYLHPLVSQQGTRLVLDLSGSPRINSEGISLLVKLNADANSHGSRVVMTSAAPFVQNVLAITRLDRFFDLQPTLSQAIDAVQSGAAR